MRWIRSVNSRFGPDYLIESHLLIPPFSYEKALGFHRFWSVDDNEIST